MLSLSFCAHVHKTHTHTNIHTTHVKRNFKTGMAIHVYIPSFSLVNLSSKIRNIYQGQRHRLVIGSCDDYMDYVVKRYYIHEL